MTSPQKKHRLRGGAKSIKPARSWKQRRDGPRAQHAQETRKALIDAARELFTSQGYHAVGVRDFAAKAGVTRGALYHHFPDKEALFLAVFDAVEQELLRESTRDLGAAGDPWIRFRKAIKRYLLAVTRPDVQRITLIDGPAVLGWAKWRELEGRYGLGAVTAALQAAMSSRAIKTRPLEPLAHLVFGSIIEAALLIAHSKDPARRLAEVAQALDALLEGL